MEPGGARSLNSDDVWPAESEEIAAVDVAEQEQLATDDVELNSATDVVGLDAVEVPCFLLAADSVSQNSVEASRVMLLAEEDVWPAESEEIAAVDVAEQEQLPTDDVELDSATDVVGLDAVKVSCLLIAADGVSQNSVEASRVVLLAEDDVAQDSVIVPDSVKAPRVLHAEVDIVPDSMESLPPGAFVCGRCELVHEDREAWNRAHSCFYPCPRCALVHADYAIAAMLGHINVDCELFMEHFKGLLPTKE